MPATPYAKLLVSLDGAARVSGSITAAAGQIVQLSGENTAGWVQQLWEITDYPDGFALPSGWSNNNGTYQSTAVTPPPFTLPSQWGKFLPRLTVNSGLLNGALAPAGSTQPLIDDTTGIRVPSVNGLQDLGFGETYQFNATKLWSGDHKANLRTIDAQFFAIRRRGYDTQFLTLDPTSPAVVAGQCLTIKGTNAILANPAALANALFIVGIAVGAASPGQVVEFAIAGVLPASLVPSLGAGLSSAVIWNPSTMRLERKAAPVTGDIVAGVTDVLGALSMRLGLGIGIGGSGSPAATPIASLDFSTLSLGTGATLPGSTTFSRASVGCRPTLGRDGSNNLVYGAAAPANNVAAVCDPGFGNGRGIELHPAARARPITPADMQFFNASATVNTTTGRTAPDGTTTATRLHWSAAAASFSAGCAGFTTGITPSGGDACVSSVRRYVGGNGVAVNLYNPYTPGTPVTQAAASATWEQIYLTTTATSGNAGHGYGGDTGVAPGPDFDVWSANIIEGLRYPLPPTGVTSAISLDSGKATHPLGTGSNSLRTGYQNLDIQFIAMGGSAEQNGVWYALSWDGSTFIRVDNTTDQLTIASGVASPVTLSTRGIYFNRGDLVHLWVRFGGGLATRAGYYVVGGPRVDLGSSGTVLPDVTASSVKLARANDDSGGLGCWLQKIDAYAINDVPPWMAGTTVASTFRPAFKQRNQLAVHGNSRIAGQTETIATIQQQLPGHLSGWSMINIGHSGYVTSGDPVHPGSNLLELAPTEIDALLDPLRFLRVIAYWEIVNGIASYNHTGADEWVRIKAYYTARVAAGWNALVFITTPLADNARFPAYGAKNSVYDDCNNLMRSEYEAFAASLGVPAKLLDIRNDPRFEYNPGSGTGMEDSAVSYDGVHFTAASYTYIQTMYSALIASLWNTSFVH